MDPSTLTRMPHAASGPLPPLPELDPDGRWREQILESLATTVYGRTPDGGRVESVTLVSEETVERPSTSSGTGERPSTGSGTGTGSNAALGIRTEWAMVLAGPHGRRVVSLLVHRPANVDRAPVLLGLNFRGNHTTTLDEGVSITTGQLVEVRSQGSDEDAVVIGYDLLPPEERGSQAAQWPYERILARGWAVATLHCSELEADAVGHAAAGVRGMFTADPAAPWGTLGAWAWGLSRAREALSEVPGIDPGRVVAIGHSRMGKAALWAVAQDPSFAGCVSIQSGCGGAALSRGKVGEHVDRITRVFPHWFTPGLAMYGTNETALPIDQHHLLAAIAPRRLHVTSAVDDLWADPRSEFLATVEATPAYASLGATGTAPQGWSYGQDPITAAVDQPPTEISRVVGGTLSYHVRPGGHVVTEEDWDLAMGALADL